MKNVNQMSKRAGFTIVELLTVMAVIAILIGLLVPALGLVHDTAQNLQQKAQFHGIKVGLELFKTEYGEYPESSDNQFDTAPGADTAPYAGANKLAEAMVGHDLLGFHPSSEFRADGTGVDPDDQTNLIDLYTANTINDREDRFVDLEKANAYRLNNIYSIASTTLDPTSYVLCDNFKKRRTGTADNKKTGMPILYFRANTRYKIQDSVDLQDESIFDYRDNSEIISLGLADDASNHDLNTLLDFDEMIINQQIDVTDVPVPYRAQSFILMSAGRDGIYGNADDIFNFDKEK